jgi:hypothetical protein
MRKILGFGSLVITVAVSCTSHQKIVISKYNTYSCNFCSEISDTSENHSSFYIDKYLNNSMFVRAAVSGPRHTQRIEYLLSRKRQHFRRVYRLTNSILDSTRKDTFYLVKDTIFILNRATWYYYLLPALETGAIFPCEQGGKNPTMNCAQSIRDTGRCNSTFSFAIADIRLIQNTSGGSVVQASATIIRNYFIPGYPIMLKQEFADAHHWGPQPHFMISDLTEIIVFYNDQRPIRQTYSCRIPNSFDLITPKYSDSLNTR